jgi:predicted O-methyltransferase YrrM
MSARADGGHPPAAIDFVEGYIGEDDIASQARGLGERMGCAPIGLGGGAALRFLASALRARAVVEVGTGVGVSGLWLLRGMLPDGTLTSIDVDPEALRVARAAFSTAGHPPSRLRLINGLGLDVLSRLTDAAYDLVLVDTAWNSGGLRLEAITHEYPKYLEEAVRLLRPGGVVVLAGALAAGVTDPDASDDGTIALRDMATAVRDDERLVAMLLPLGDGLLAAVRTT